MITVKGIAIESLTVSQNKETEGRVKIVASYNLISPNDKILAKQEIGGYHPDLALEPSTETLVAIEKFIAAYKADISKAIGLDVE